MPTVAGAECGGDMNLTRGPESDNFAQRPSSRSDISKSLARRCVHENLQFDSVFTGFPRVARSDVFQCPANPPVPAILARHCRRSERRYGKTISRVFSE